VVLSTLRPAYHIENFPDGDSARTVNDSVAAKKPVVGERNICVC